MVPQSRVACCASRAAKLIGAVEDVQVIRKGRWLQPRHRSHTFEHNVASLGHLAPPSHPLLAMSAVNGISSGAAVPSAPAKKRMTQEEEWAACEGLSERERMVKGSSYLSSRCRKEQG